MEENVMYVTITNDCTGCGACAAINPEVFDIVNNKAVVNDSKVEYNEDDCIDAALACPVDAIKIDDF